MHHKFWNPETGEVTLPAGYCNDEDGDAPPLDTAHAHAHAHAHAPGNGVGDGDGDVVAAARAYAEDELRRSVGAGYTSSSGPGSGSGSVSGAWTDDSSLLSGSSSLQPSSASTSPSGNKPARRETADERKARWRREKVARMQGKKAGLAKLAEETAPKKEGEASAPTPPPEQKDIVVTDSASIASQLSAKLDPSDPAVWRALEARYYEEICAYALDYEANKTWTKERRMPNGVRGMQEACRQYAAWRAFALKSLVTSIDEEQRRDVQRIEVEDQIVDEARLQAQVKKHDEERHAHRTLVRASLYETEIVTVNRLYKMGLLW